MVKSLHVIHDLGYSHGDIKPENICARQTEAGQFNFTLIGFGNSLKLVKLGQARQDNKVYRGNLIFASLPCLERSWATQLDDLFSLLGVAYFFIEGSLPWLDYIESRPKLQQETLLMSSKNYIEMRKECSESFLSEMCKKGGELKMLIQMIDKAMMKFEKADRRMLRDNK